jgi:prepilin signal peptidase PulO-like enzyme (type II secretory pathway)
LIVTQDTWAAMQPIVLLALVFGFVGGVIVNLLADYLPARRYHYLASADPFVSRSAVPPLPVFIPRRADGRPWPLPLWSGLIATLTRAPVYDPARRVRRISTELGLAVVFGWIASVYGGHRSLPFLLFYAAVFALVAIVDTEYRWILPETIWPPALVAIAEAAFWPRVSLETSLRGGLYGFLSLFALYILGILFSRLVGVVRRRRIGRTVLGFGDVRMATLGGLIVGWNAIGPALLIMILTGAIAALVFIANRLLRSGHYRVFSAIPYGPYIVIGFAAMLYTPWIAGSILTEILGGS